MQPETTAKAGSGATANRTNPRVNAAARAGGALGRASLATAAGLGAYEVASSKDKPRTAAGVAGSVGGGVAGGIAGAEFFGGLGAVVGGPPGALVGAIGGGLAGSLAGGLGARELATRGYDAFSRHTEDARYEFNKAIRDIKDGYHPMRRNSDWR